MLFAAGVIETRENLTRAINPLFLRMGLVLAMAAVFWAAGILAASQADAQEIPLLFVEEDETTTELELMEFLKVRTNWTIERAEFGSNIGDDSYLRIPFTLEDDREVTIMVDSLPSAQSGSERRIQVYGWIVVEVGETHARRRDLLELLNTIQKDNWSAQRLYLDGDGDVAYAWSINIPGKRAPVHAEQVYDAIIRTKLMLDTLSPKLNELGLF